MIWVFDDGPLSHFSEAGWLGLLKAAIGSAEAWIPETVQRELAEGSVHHAHLRTVLQADWLQVSMLSSGRELAAFGEFAERLVGKDGKNLGECGVLALARVRGGVAVVDDGAARTVAAEFRVPVKTTVGLLCDLVRDRLVGLELASTVADDLLATEYRLPFARGEFIRFVREHDLLPYE